MQSYSGIRILLEQVRSDRIGRLDLTYYDSNNNNNNNNNTRTPVGRGMALGGSGTGGERVSKGVGVLWAMLIYVWHPLATLVMTCPLLRMAMHNLLFCS